MQVVLDPSPFFWRKGSEGSSSQTRDSQADDSVSIKFYMIVAFFTTK